MTLRQLWDEATHDVPTTVAGLVTAAGVVTSLPTDRLSTYVLAAESHVDKEGPCHEGNHEPPPPG